MNKIFADYSTKSLSLTVSRPQIQMLFAMSQGFHPTDIRNDSVSQQSLCRKGLAFTAPYSAVPELSIYKERVILYSCYISRAGELVVELAKEAGIDYTYELSEHALDRTMHGRYSSGHSIERLN